ncbi:MAG: peptidase M22 [Oscillospiraceae bacterium]|nr:peptidase M22 [Oscillospiraceae bacterium]
MSFFLGVDSSNYTSSAAVINSDSMSVNNQKQLLNVQNGQLGLRQSEAVFQHVKNLPSVIESALEAADDTISAIGVSDKPRSLDGSYMPCFLVGESIAESISAALKIPIYRFSHQAGHIAAALYSANSLNLINKQFIAFHVSGGTTEAVMVTPDKQNVFNCEIIAKSLDLKFGQAVDRVGNMLELPFPSGKYLDELAQNGSYDGKINISLKGCDCNVSGLENNCRKLFENSCSKEDIARFTVEYIYKTIDGMTEALIKKYGKFPLVFAGGVMSNSIIRERMTNKYGALFATPQFSSDNAGGIAVLAMLRHNMRV